MGEWVPVGASPLKRIPSRTVNGWFRKGILNKTHVKTVGRYRYVNLDTVTEELVAQIKTEAEARQCKRPPGRPPEDDMSVKEIKRVRAAVASYDGDTSRYDTWLKEAEA